MKRILLLLFLAIFLNVISVNAANLICGAGSIGTCPTVGNECPQNSTCSYTGCTCVVTGSQLIDSNVTYYFTNLTIPSGVNVNISTQAAGGNNACTAGSNGPGVAQGGSGGASGFNCASGGSYAGGGGGGGADSPGGCSGGNTSGGGGGGSPVTYGGTGGKGGGKFTVYANVINIFGTINATGGNGTSGAAAFWSGGGGGGGGGQVFLNGNWINISGIINVTGGMAGGGGAAGGGGGGGGGGYIQILYACSYSNGTFLVSGGAGGTGGGSGSCGASGSSGNSGSINASKINQSYSFNQALNITLKNQTNLAISGASVNYYEAGNTSNVICNVTTDSNGFVGLGFGDVTTDPNLKKIFDINITATGTYRQNIWYKAARAPGSISVDGNKKWVPESTLSTSKLFTAGHIVPTEIHILSPYTIYNIGNISLEDWSPTNTTFASNVLFEKFNSSGRYTCDALPSNTTYYFIDKTDCTFLNYLNVTADEWLRVTYRIKIEGPVAFSSIGQVKNYTLLIAKLRFDVAS